MQLAQAHVKDRLQEVVRIVAKALSDINRMNEAAEIYDNFGLFQEAAISYMQAKNFSKAENSAQQINNADVSLPPISFSQSVCLTAFTDWP